jgi:hypothetical protein
MLHCNIRPVNIASTNASYEILNVFLAYLFWNLTGNNKKYYIPFNTILYSTKLSFRDIISIIVWPAIFFFILQWYLIQI